MVAILLGADNGFFYAGQIMHFSSPFTVFLIYHKQYWYPVPQATHSLGIMYHALFSVNDGLLFKLALMWFLQAMLDAAYTA